ncbi:MAG: hypothetical protein JXA99_03705, partial [Candidatus Lokiarchaeota archaeon]|nr:hypothetical protein [Candidatus Lokiarchaeota archaeon]
ELKRETNLLKDKLITSVLLENVRFKLKELIYSDFIDDEIRFEMMLNYFDIWVFKNNIVIKELKLIGFRFDRLQSEYKQACCIQKVLNKKVFKFEKNNAYISTDIEEINESVLLPMLYPVGYRHRSNYIECKTAKYKLRNKDTGEMKDIKDVSKVDLNDYDRVYANKVPYNAYCDTEDEWYFYICTDYKLADLTSRMITREEFLMYMDENLEHLRSLTSDEMINITYNPDDLDNSNMLKHKIYAKSKLTMIQVLLEDEKTGEYQIYLIINQEKREHYNKNTLEYTYKKTLNGEVKEITEKARVIYTDNPTDYYLNVLIDWYKHRHYDCDSRRLRMNIYFHNLKFDILTIGLIDLFEKYNFELNNMNLTTPTFFDYKCNFDIENRKGKKIDSKLVFLDSMNFQATSLKNLGKAVGINKESEKVDFYWNDNLTVNRSFLEYSLMDVVILRNFMYDLKQEVQFDTSFTAYGAAGTAINSFLTSKYGKEVDENRLQKRMILKYFDSSGNEIDKEDYKKLSKDEKEKIKKEKQIIETPRQIKIHKHKNRILEKIAIASYTGGRTQCHNMIGYYEWIMSIDVNSSYPSSMYQKLPYEYHQSYLNPDLDTVNKILYSDNMYSIAYIYVGEDFTEIPPNKRHSMVCFDYNIASTMLIHEPELKELLKFNNTVKIIELHTYYASDKIFSEFVDEGMFNKSYYKMIEYNEIKVTYYKLTRNSCYGKFGEKERIGITKQMNYEEKIFYKFLLSMKYERIITDEDLEKYVGYIDITLDESYFMQKIIDSKLMNVFNINPLTYNNIYRNITNLYDESVKSVRISIIRDYISFTKKIDRPGQNASPEIAGAITSYSRVALYKARNILGKDRVLYCDTDSLYFKLYKGENAEMIKEKYFNEIEISEDELKKKFNSMSSYKIYLKEVESKCVNDKINVSKGLVSKKFLWEIEKPDKDSKEIVYSMLTRGNKDNIKFVRKSISDLFIIDDKNTYEDFKNSKFKLCVKKEVLEDIKKDKSVHNNNSILLKFNEKMKGVSKQAINVNNNLYLNMQWLSLKTNSNMFKTYSNQFVVPMLKSLEGRDEYKKADIVKKSKKKCKFVIAVDLKDSFKNSIGNKQEIIGIKEVTYTQQYIKPFTVTNINQDEKYFSNNGFIIISDKAKLVDIINNKKYTTVGDYENKKVGKRDISKSEYKEKQRLDRIKKKETRH